MNKIETQKITRSKWVTPLMALSLVLGIPSVLFLIMIVDYHWGQGILPLAGLVVCVLLVWSISKSIIIYYKNKDGKYLYTSEEAVLFLPLLLVLLLFIPMILDSIGNFIRNPFSPENIVLIIEFIFYLTIFFFVGKWIRKKYF